MPVRTVLKRFHIVSVPNFNFITICFNLHFQGFVKEILTEIAVYNTMPPHKSMWELKPEYRNYRKDKKEAE